MACWKLETFNYLLPVDKQQNFGRQARGILRICNVSKQHLGWGPLYMRVLGQDPGIPVPACLCKAVPPSSYVPVRVMRSIFTSFQA